MAIAKEATTILLLFMIFLGSSADEKYLADQPKFLQPCGLHTPEFLTCFGDNFQKTLNNWRSGVPGLSSIGSIDPISIKRISISQDQSNAIIQMNADLTNVKAEGIAKSTFTANSFDTKKLVVKATIIIPQLKVTADYAGKGHIFNLNIDSHGKTDILIENAKIIVGYRAKLRNEFDHTFTDIDKFKLEIVDVGGFKIHLGNLFNGQTDLEENTNMLINESWREFYPIMAPAIGKAMEAVMSEWLRRTFSYVPAEYFVHDIATAGA